jgi:hypothetical protein
MIGALDAGHGSLPWAAGMLLAAPPNQPQSIIN